MKLFCEQTNTNERQRLSDKLLLFVVVLFTEMSLDQLKSFIEKVKSDTNLQAKVLAAGAQNAVAIEKIAKDAG